jgi:ABC-type branched-subunit amino acid transport system ATPase component
VAPVRAEATGGVSGDDLIVVRGLTRRFGGLAAVDGLDFELRRGEILALIGPNGAGKTTVFNLVGGADTPTSGTIALDGVRIDGMPPHRVAAHGIMRTFQHNMPFPSMSLADNVLVGRHLRLQTGVAAALLGTRLRQVEDAAARRVAAELIEFVGLSERRDAAVATLSFGEGRLLELARALAGEPHALLLDEPAAGLTQAEAAQLGRVIRAVAARGNAVLLIEHDMHFLLPLAQRIVVLNFGRKIAEGTPDEMLRHPAVIEAYLGAAAATLATVPHA